jgi:mannitol-specific phosphotransferase system IIBC component
MREFWSYTAARLGIFVASYAVVLGVYVLVTHSDKIPVLWPLLLAAAISAVASVRLLRGQRARFASRVESRASKMSQAFEAQRAKEDTD